MSQAPPETDGPQRRLGDAIEVSGDYQHRALTEGPAVQRYWHTAKLDLLEWVYRPERGDRVLDVGCGSGVVADRLRSCGAEVFAVDANPDAVDYARRTFARDGLNFLRGYLDELDLEKGSFDGAVSLEVIEHVYPPQVRKLLADLFSLLRGGGHLLLTTPNYRGLWPLVEWVADRFSTTAKMHEDQHVTRFHRRTLRRFVEEAGFEIVELRTYCTLAPFIAALTWRGAKAIDRLERAVDLPFGNILVTLARKPA